MSMMRTCLSISAGENALAIARYTLAVDRRFRRDGEASADFISCVSFGRTAEFAEKYFRQGLKIAVTGRIQTGSYTNREGQKVYTTEVVVEDQEFAFSTTASRASSSSLALTTNARAADIRSWWHVSWLRKIHEI